MGINKLNNKDNTYEIKDNNPINKITKKLKNSYKSRDISWFFDQINSLSQLMKEDVAVKIAVERVSINDPINPLSIIFDKISIPKHEELLEFWVPIIAHRLKWLNIVKEARIDLLNLKVFTIDLLKSKMIDSNKAHSILSETYDRSNEFGNFDETIYQTIILKNLLQELQKIRENNPNRSRPAILRT